MYKVPENWTVNITRFICVSIYHLFAMNDMTSASVSLKYLSMHHNEFEHLSIAAFFMVIKFSICFFVEAINVLIIVRTTTHKDCIENLMALSTILLFSKIFYKILPGQDRLLLGKAEDEN